MRRPGIQLAAAVFSFALIPPLTASLTEDESNSQMLRLLTRR